MENSTSGNIDLLIHIITKILEMIHSKNYTKKRAKCKKIHGHIKVTVKFEIRRVMTT
jgi:hypothetical protein